MTADLAGPASPLAAVALDEVVVVDADVPIGEVACRMRDADVDAVLVGDGRARIVSERDLVCALADGRPPDTPVGSIAARRPHTVSDRAFVRDAAELMAVERLRHLVVVSSDGRAVGILSLGRIVESLLRGVDPHTWALVLRLGARPA
jgi:signal-transduction protein with cAMP-binding, CBS, and nucleotidyltransferase domain